MKLIVDLDELVEVTKSLESGLDTPGAARIRRLIAGCPTLEDLAGRRFADGYEAPGYTGTSGEQVLQLLFDSEEPLSVGEIADRLEGNRGSLEAVVKDLRDAGAIHVVDYRGGGARYSLDPPTEEPVEPEREPQEPAPKPLSERVQDVLLGSASPLTVVQIAGQLQLRDTSMLRTVVRRLVDDGLVVTVGRGPAPNRGVAPYLYAAADSPAAHVTVEANDPEEQAHTYAAASAVVSSLHGGPLSFVQIRERLGVSNDSLRKVLAQLQKKGEVTVTETPREGELPIRLYQLVDRAR